jgi:hypothetical protein
MTDRQFKFFSAYALALMIMIFALAGYALLRDDYDMKIANDGSVYRMNNKTGFLEYCVEATDDNKKQFVICFPEKKWSDVGYFRK